jgi:hypothetical protein
VGKTRNGRLAGLKHSSAHAQTAASLLTRTHLQTYQSSLCRREGGQGGKGEKEGKNGGAIRSPSVMHAPYNAPVVNYSPINLSPRPSSPASAPSPSAAMHTREMPGVSTAWSQYSPRTRGCKQPQRTPDSMKYAHYASLFSEYQKLPRIKWICATE